MAVVFDVPSGVTQYSSPDLNPVVDTGAAVPKVVVSTRGVNPANRPALVWLLIDIQPPYCWIIEKCVPLTCVVTEANPPYLNCNVLPAAKYTTIVPLAVRLNKPAPFD